MPKSIFRGFYESDVFDEKVNVDGKIHIGKWIYWNEFGHMCDEDGRKTGGNVIDLAVIPCTIGEGVRGRYDGNGKQIFEGDVIKSIFTFDDDEEEEIDNVYYDTDIDCWMIKDMVRCCLPSPITDLADDCEITGTIFDVE